MGMFCDLRAYLIAKSITSMLSLSHETRRHRVVIDSKNHPDVKVQIASVVWMRFVLNYIGLRAHGIRRNAEPDHNNTEAASGNVAKQQVRNYSFVQTAEENTKNHTSAEAKDANEAKTFAKRMVGMPL